MSRCQRGSITEKICIKVPPLLRYCIGIREPFSTWKLVFISIRISLPGHILKS